MPDRFILVYSGETKDYDDPYELITEYEDKYYLVDTNSNAIVFADGSYEAPEDNNLGRHYGALVDLLNQVDAE